MITCVCADKKRQPVLPFCWCLLWCHPSIWPKWACIGMVSKWFIKSCITGTPVHEVRRHAQLCIKTLDFLLLKCNLYVKTLHNHITWVFICNLCYISLAWTAVIWKQKALSNLWYAVKNWVGLDECVSAKGVQVVIYCMCGEILTEELFNVSEKLKLTLHIR